MVSSITRRIAYNDCAHGRSRPNSLQWVRLDGGMTLVQLTSQASLYDEAMEMHNCIDSAQHICQHELQSHHYFSIRNTANRSNATIVTNSDNTIEEAEGYKQNSSALAPLHGEYWPILKMAIERMAWKNGMAFYLTGVFEQDGTLYNLFDLPKDFTFKGHLDFNFVKEGFSGKLVAPPLTIPDGLTIDGNATFKRRTITRIGHNVSVRVLNLTDTTIDDLPQDLCAACVQLPDRQVIPDKWIKDYPRVGRFNVAGHNYPTMTEAAAMQNTKMAAVTNAQNRFLGLSG